MSWWRALGRGAALTVPVVVLNAAVQAAVVAPALTPATEPGFVALAVVSFLAFSAAATLVATTAAVTARGGRPTPPGGWTWLAGALVVLAVALSALAGPVVVPVVIVLATIVLPAIAAGSSRLGAVFAAFCAAPVRASVLVLVSIVAVVLVGAAALLLGFFVTGWLGAGLTWLIGGAVAVLLLQGWAALHARA